MIVYSQLGPFILRVTSLFESVMKILIFKNNHSQKCHYRNQSQKRFKLRVIDLRVIDFKRVIDLKGSLER